MPAGVLPLSDRICRDFRILRMMSIAEATIALVCVPVVVLYTSSSHWILLGVISLYAARKIWQFVRNDRVVKQIRLEERFFRQQMDGSTLARCVRRSEHVWDDSRTLRGLRAILARPLPRLLSQSEKTHLVQQKYHRVFRSLRPAMVRLDILVPLATGAWLLRQSFPTDPPRWVSLVIVAVAALALLELAEIKLSFNLRQRFASYERALSAWTLDRSDIASLFIKPRPGYRHDLLYRADPLYTAGTPRTFLRRAEN